MLALGAHVEKSPFVRDELGHLVCFDDVALSGQDVFCHIAEHVHRILGRRERWCVGEFEICQRVGGDASSDRGSDDVYPFVHTVFPDRLRAKDSTVDGIEQQLQRQPRRARGGRRVVEGVRVDHAVGNLSGTQAALVPSSHRHDQIEDLDDCRAECWGGMYREARDVVGGTTALPVGDVGERDERRGGTHRVGLFGCVADCVDVEVTRLIGTIYSDAAKWAAGQASHLCEADIGSDADRSYYEICEDSLAGRQYHLRLGDLGHANANFDVDPMRSKLFENEHGKFGVERRQYLWRSFDDGDRYSCVREVLRGLKTDETRTDHSRAARMVMYCFGKRLCVLDGSQRPQALNSWNRRSERGRAGTENQLVVKEHVRVRIEGRSCRDAFCSRVDRDDLAVDADIKAETLVK